MSSFRIHGDLPKSKDNTKVEAKMQKLAPTLEALHFGKSSNNTCNFMWIRFDLFSNFWGKIMNR